MTVFFVNSPSSTPDNPKSQLFNADCSIPILLHTIESWYQKEISTQSDNSKETTKLPTDISDTSTKPQKQTQPQQNPSQPPSQPSDTSEEPTTFDLFDSSNTPLRLNEHKNSNGLEFITPFSVYTGNYRNPNEPAQPAPGTKGKPVAQAAKK
ncbi:hypothetical protein BLNAU_4577 [Blattamonas nauphoetae]|uniref:Uncharacterized protein n=1 Tax=Blattamonas nauphoetae TaxID=2049346 RepID=A0ABQ9Y9F1_9EUKA|nr:hypothetical protein BLNAU_4577 [Blattamonas nauphoetae]